MAEHEFADQLFQVLNYNRRMEIATLTIEPFQTPPTLHIQLCSDRKAEYFVPAFQSHKKLYSRGDVRFPFPTDFQ